MEAMWNPGLSIARKMTTHNGGLATVASRLRYSHTWQEKDRC
jgi:hypothetical protein